MTSIHEERKFEGEIILKTFECSQTQWDSTSTCIKKKSWHKAIKVKVLLIRATYPSSRKDDNDIMNFHWLLLKMFLSQGVFAQASLLLETTAQVNRVYAALLSASILFHKINIK